MNQSGSTVGAVLMQFLTMRPGVHAIAYGAEIGHCWAPAGLKGLQMDSTWIVQVISWPVRTTSSSLRSIETHLLDNLLGSLWHGRWKGLSHEFGWLPCPRIVPVPCPPSYSLAVSNCLGVIVCGAMMLWYAVCYPCYHWTLSLLYPIFCVWVVHCEPCSTWAYLT